MRIAARARIAAVAWRTDLGAYRRERFDLFMRARSRIRARVISRPIVRRGRFRQLLVGGTQLGQGVNPVREDSFQVCRRIDRASSRTAVVQIPSKLKLSPTRIRYGVASALRNYRRRLVRTHTLHIARVHCRHDVIVRLPRNHRRIRILLGRQKGRVQLRRIRSTRRGAAVDVVPGNR